MATSDFGAAHLGDYATSNDTRVLSAPPTPLDDQIRRVQKHIQGLSQVIARLLSQVAVAKDRGQKARLFKNAQETSKQRADQRAKLLEMLTNRAKWQARNRTVTSVAAAKQLRANAAPSIEARLRATAKVTAPPSAALATLTRNDPFRTGLTLALAPRAQRFYTEQLRTCRNPALCDYYRQRLQYTQSVLRAAAPGRKTRADLLAEVTRLRRLAAAAKARKDYAMNQRLQQQAEQMEQQMRVSTAWSPTAPESNVAPSTASDAALTFTQARAAALAPVTEAARAASEEAPDASEDTAVEASTDESSEASTEASTEETAVAGATEKPWYVRYALPLALAAAAGIGLAVLGKKGKGAGHFKLLRHGHAPSHPHHAAK